ncbi:MAG: MarR family transcriptional regulator [Phycisphaerae bacterium]|nr:MarR family transcriptional regulator [Phycisphaerae bacterium]
MPTQPLPEEIQRMAEEIFDVWKLSWIDRAGTNDKDEFDLSEAELLTLDLLTKSQSMNVGELQRSIDVLPAQMSRVIRSLEQKGGKPLVSCSLNLQDKRKIDVSITDLGRHALQSYQATKLATLMSVLSDLDESDRRDFIRILRTIRDKLVTISEAKRQHP